MNHPRFNSRIVLLSLLSSMNCMYHTLTYDNTIYLTTTFASNSIKVSYFAFEKLMSLIELHSQHSVCICEIYSNNQKNSKILIYSKYYKINMISSFILVFCFLRLVCFLKHSISFPKLEISFFSCINFFAHLHLSSWRPPKYLKISNKISK